MRTNPPVWAEAILRGFLKTESFGNVSGDLLEQYRDSILPTRGLLRADRWYLSQVCGYVLRAALPWATLFAIAMVARNTLDWVSPATDYYARSVTTTALATGILLGSGFRTAWRSRSFLGGAVAGLTTSISCRWTDHRWERDPPGIFRCRPHSEEWRAGRPFSSAGHANPARHGDRRYRRARGSWCKKTVTRCLNADFPTPVVPDERKQMINEEMQGMLRIICERSCRQIISKTPPCSFKAEFRLNFHGTATPR